VPTRPTVNNAMVDRATSILVKEKFSADDCLEARKSIYGKLGLTVKEDRVALRKKMEEKYGGEE